MFSPSKIHHKSLARTFFFENLLHCLSFFVLSTQGQDWICNTHTFTGGQGINISRRKLGPFSSLWAKLSMIINEDHRLGSCFIHEFQVGRGGGHGALGTGDSCCFGGQEATLRSR